jgi:hypothetical protein
MSIPTWYAQFLFLVTSVVALSLAFLERSRASFRYWVFLASILLLGSMNEVASIHESVLQIIHLEQFGENPSTYLENAWIVVLPFILIASVLSLYLAYLTLPRSVSMVIILSAGVYLSGAVGIDIFDGVLTERTFFEQGVLAVLEEGLELMGISLLLFGLVRYLEAHYRERISAAIAVVDTNR